MPPAKKITFPSFSASTAASFENREVNPEAKKYDEISIQEIIDKKLMAVDLTASIMCLENKMPMLVFGLNEENSIVETMSGNFNGTKVTV